MLSVHARAWRAMALADVGRSADGLVLAQEAVQIATDARNAFSQTTAYLSLGSVLLRAGNLGGALTLLERSVALCRDGNFFLLVPPTASMFGTALTMAGRVDEALPLLERAVETAAAKGLIGGASKYSVRLGNGLLAARRTKDAGALATRALEAARQRKERGHEAWALHLLGGDCHSWGRAECQGRGRLLRGGAGPRPDTGHAAARHPMPGPAGRNVLECAPTFPRVPLIVEPSPTPPKGGLTR